MMSPENESAEFRQDSMKNYSNSNRPLRRRRQGGWINHKAIYRDAARSLERRWGKAAAGFLFLIAIWVLCWLLRTLIREAASITGAPISLEGQTMLINLPRIIIDMGMLFVSIVLFSPLLLGYIRFLYQLTTGREAPLMMIFDELRSVRTLLKSMWSVVMMSFWTLVVIGCCLLPGGLACLAAGTLTNINGKNQALFLALVMLAVVLIILGTGFIAALLGRFMAVPFILTDERTGFFTAVSRSWRITGEDSSGTFLFVLSFFPICLLCVLLIPAVFVVPYFIASTGLYTRILIDKEIRRKNMESVETSEQR